MGHGQHVDRDNQVADLVENLDQVHFANLKVLHVYVVAAGEQVQVDDQAKLNYWGHSEERWKNNQHRVDKAPDNEEDVVVGHVLKHLLVLPDHRVLFVEVWVLGWILDLKYVGSDQDHRTDGAKD